MSYLKIKPECGKWYISEGFKSNIRPDTPNLISEMCHTIRGVAK